MAMARLTCRVLVLLLLFTLVANLVNRYRGASSARGDGFHATSSRPTWQQLDQDAIEWVKPILAFTTLHPRVFYPLVAPAGPHVPVLHLDQSLYKRPPPSC